MAQDSQVILCGCGEPLHYTSAETQAAVEQLVEELGPLVSVTTPEGTWRVPRHYIALHGFKGADVPGLAAQYNWEKVN